MVTTAVSNLRGMAWLLLLTAPQACSLVGREHGRSIPFSEVGPSPAAPRCALMRVAGTETHGGHMYIVIRKYTKVRSVADAARRAKSGVGQILRKSKGFRSYYILNGGEGVGLAVMIFEDRESANAANDKVLQFVQASLHDLDLGDPEIIAGEVLVNIESDV